MSSPRSSPRMTLTPRSFADDGEAWDADVARSPWGLWGYSWLDDGGGSADWVPVSTVGAALRSLRRPTPPTPSSPFTPAMAGLSVDGEDCLAFPAGLLLSPTLMYLAGRTTAEPDLSPAESALELTRTVSRYGGRPAGRRRTGDDDMMTSWEAPAEVDVGGSASSMLVSAFELIEDVTQATPEYGELALEPPPAAHTLPPWRRSQASPASPASHASDAALFYTDLSPSSSFSSPATPTDYLGAVEASTDAWLYSSVSGQPTHDVYSLGLHEGSEVGLGRGDGAVQRAAAGSVTGEGSDPLTSSTGLGEEEDWDALIQPSLPPSRSAGPRRSGPPAVPPTPAVCPSPRATKKSPRPPPTRPPLPAPPSLPRAGGSTGGSRPASRRSVAALPMVPARGPLRVGAAPAPPPDRCEGGDTAATTTTPASTGHVSVFPSTPPTRPPPQFPRFIHLLRVPGDRRAAGVGSRFSAPRCVLVDVRPSPTLNLCVGHARATFDEAAVVSTLGQEPPAAQRTVRSDFVARIGADLAGGLSASLVSLYAAGEARGWSLLLPCAMEATFAALAGAPADPAAPARRRLGGRRSNAECATTADTSMRLTVWRVEVSVCVVKDDLWRDALAPQEGGADASCAAASVGWRARKLVVGGSPLLGVRFEGATQCPIASVGDLRAVVDRAQASLSPDDTQRGCTVVSVLVSSRHRPVKVAAGPPSARTAAEEEVLLSSCTVLAATPLALRDVMGGGWLPHTERLVELVLHGPRRVGVFYDGARMRGDEAEAALGLVSLLRRRGVAVPVPGRVHEFVEATQASARVLEEQLTTLSSSPSPLDGAAPLPSDQPQLLAGPHKGGDADVSGADPRSHSRRPGEGGRVVLRERRRTCRSLKHASAQCKAFSTDYAGILSSGARWFPQVYTLTRYSRLFHTAPRRPPAEERARSPLGHGEGGRGEGAACASGLAVVSPPGSDGKHDSLELGPTPGKGKGSPNAGDDTPRLARKQRPLKRLSRDLREWALHRPLPNVFASAGRRTSPRRAVLPFHAGDDWTASVFGMGPAFPARAPGWRGPTLAEQQGMPAGALLVGLRMPKAVGPDREDPTARYTDGVETVILMDTLRYVDGRGCGRHGRGVPAAAVRLRGREAGAADPPVQYVDLHTVRVYPARRGGAASSTARSDHAVTDNGQLVFADEVCVPPRTTPTRAGSLSDRPRHTSAVLDTAFHDFMNGHNVTVASMVGRSITGSAAERIARTPVLTAHLHDTIEKVVAQPGWELYVSVTESLSRDVLRDHVRLSCVREAATGGGGGAAVMGRCGAPASPRQVPPDVPELARGSMAFRAAWTPAGPVAEGARFVRVRSNGTVNTLLHAALSEGAGEHRTLYLTLLLRRPAEVDASASATWSTASSIASAAPAGPHAGSAPDDVLFCALSLIFTTSPALLRPMSLEQTVTMDHSLNLLLTPFRRRYVIVADVATCTLQDTLPILSELAVLRWRARFPRVAHPWRMSVFRNYLETRAADLRGARAVASSAPTESGSMGVTSLFLDDTGSPAGAAEVCDTGSQWLVRTTWLLLQRMLGITAELQLAPSESSPTPSDRPARSLAACRLTALSSGAEVYDLLAPLPPRACPGEGETREAPSTLVVAPTPHPPSPGPAPAVRRPASRLSEFPAVPAAALAAPPPSATHPRSGTDPAMVRKALPLTRTSAVRAVARLRRERAAVGHEPGGRSLIDAVHLPAPPPHSPPTSTTMPPVLGRVRAGYVADVAGRP